MAYFPLFVEINEYNCLIVGGGSVACRKAAALHEYGAGIIAVAPDFCPEFLMLNRNMTMRLEQRPFEKEDLEGVNLVIAATDDRELNHSIGKLCKAKNLPVNVADSKEECSFLFPALVKINEISIGISTGGTSPAVARCIKDRIENVIPEHVGTLTHQMSVWRPYVKEKIEDYAVRGRIYHDLAEYGMEHPEGITGDMVDTMIQHRLEELKHE